MTSLPAVVPAIPCPQLAALNFTSGSGAAEVEFRVSSATVADIVPPGGTVAVPTCQVIGYAHAQVRFEVRLPMKGWTQRFMMIGCGGYCGGLVWPAPLNTAWNCAPVGAGEMVLATHDGGHQRNTAAASANTPGPFADGLWARGNPDAVVDFAYRGVHKATLAAKALIKAFYGQPQRFAYYNGCSDGGRAALQTVQRYPADYDGVLAGASTIDEVQTNTFYHAWNVRKNAAGTVPGTNPTQYTPILTADKIAGLHATVLARCADFGNGLKDMVRDPRACRLDARSLVCNGADAPDCLSAAQADVVNKMWTGPVDETGELMSAGNMPIGSEPGWVGSMVTAPGTPIAMNTSSDYQFSWDFPRYMAQWGEPLDIDVRNMAFTRAAYAQLTPLVPLYNPTNPDLRPFFARGGKLLLWHGWADTGSSVWHSLNYWSRVRSVVGTDVADKAMALYMVPGVYHCNAGPRASAQDFQTPLMDWVESATAPGKVVVEYFSDATRNTLAKRRPVWPFPAVAQFDGKGDANAEASFEPVTPADKLPTTLEWLGLKDYAPGQQMWCEASGTALACTPGKQP